MLTDQPPGRQPNPKRKALLELLGHLWLLAVALVVSGTAFAAAESARRYFSSDGAEVQWYLPSAEVPVVANPLTVGPAVRLP